MEVSIETVIRQFYNWGISLMNTANEAWFWLTKDQIDFSAIGGPSISVADILFSSAMFTLFAWWCVKQFINPRWD